MSFLGQGQGQGPSEGIGSTISSGLNSITSGLGMGSSPTTTNVGFDSFYTTVLTIAVVVLILVLAFLGLHFYDFWVHEITYKYVNVNEINPTRYYEELNHKFESPVRTGLYSLAFVLLSMHLWHGFNSSFQSVGFNNKYSKALHKLGYAFAIIVPLGFIVIALFHHFNQI